MTALYIDQLEKAAVDSVVVTSKAGYLSGNNALFKVLEKQGLVHFCRGYVVKGPELAAKTCRNDHRGRINKVIMSALGIPESKIHPESNFVEDLGADSLDAIELIMYLESEFDVSIPDEDEHYFETVQGVYNYFEGKE